MASKYFKIGDRVKCLDAGGDRLALTRGKIYTATRTSNGLVGVVNDSGNITEYFTSRFELAPPPPPPPPPVLEIDLKQLDEMQLVILRERINQKLIDQDWEAKRRAKLDVTRGEFEDLKAAVNAPK